MSYFGWIKKKEIASILIEIHKQYEVKEGPVPQEFFLGGQDSIELALEKIIGQKEAFAAINRIRDDQKPKKAKALTNRSLS